MSKFYDCRNYGLHGCAREDTGGTLDAHEMNHARKIIPYDKVKYIGGDAPSSDCYGNAFLLCVPADSALVYVEGYIKLTEVDGIKRKRHAWVYDPENKVSYEVSPISGLANMEGVPGREGYGYEITREELLESRKPVLSDDELLPYLQNAD